MGSRTKCYKTAKQPVLRSQQARWTTPQTTHRLRGGTWPGRPHKRTAATAPPGGSSLLAAKATAAAAWLYDRRGMRQQLYLCEEGRAATQNQHKVGGRAGSSAGRLLQSVGPALARPPAPACAAGSPGLQGWHSAWAWLPEAARPGLSPQAGRRPAVGAHRLEQALAAQRVPRKVQGARGRPVGCAMRSRCERNESRSRVQADVAPATPSPILFSPIPHMCHCV